MMAVPLVGCEAVQPSAKVPATEPTYAVDVPESVTTPDTVRTEALGKLEFFDGMPSEETVEKLYDHLDLVRGVTAFPDGILVASIQGFVNGLPDAGVQPNEIGLTETLQDARSIWLTCNTTTIYVTSIVDTSDGPVVIHVPSGTLALLDDAAFQYVGDFGPLGPTSERVGSAFCCPPPAMKRKSQTATSSSARSPALDGDGETEGVVAEFKRVMNIYPLSAAANPPEERVVNRSDLQHCTALARPLHLLYPGTNAKYAPTRS
jgi:hypothetical protein